MRGTAQTYNAANEITSVSGLSFDAKGNPNTVTCQTASFDILFFL